MRFSSLFIASAFSTCSSKEKKNFINPINDKVVFNCPPNNPSATEASSMADMKNVMPLLMSKIAGKGDGKLASNIVKEILQG